MVAIKSQYDVGLHDVCRWGNASTQPSTNLAKIQDSHLYPFSLFCIPNVIEWAVY